MGFTQRDMPADVWAKLVAAGQPQGCARKVREVTEKAVLVAASFTFPNVWVVPVEVPSLGNSREWRLRNRVAQAHRRAVSVAFGKALWCVAGVADCYHRGEPVTVKLTRLGGQKMDRSNLPAALKYIEDGVALMMGADDGAPNWNCVHNQEPGGGVGVRIELTSGDRT